MALIRIEDMVNTFADEVLFDEARIALQTLEQFPNMSQVEGMFRRAQGIRFSREIFHDGKKVGDNSFESWLQSRILLSKRRGDRHYFDHDYFSLVHDRLFGSRFTSIKRASKKLLDEQGIDKPPVEQRQELWVALFHHWITQIYMLSRYLLRSQISNRRHQSRTGFQSRKYPGRGGKR